MAKVLYKNHSIAYVTLLLIGMLMSKIINAHFFEFPKAAGTYSVGITSLHLTDHNRYEPYCPDAKKARELMVTAWYPTDREDM